LLRWRPWAREAGGVLVGALLLGVLCYLPFYLGFRSQASGVMPVAARTQWHHFLLFWGPLYLVTATFLGALVAQSWRQTPETSWTRSRVMWAVVAAVSLAMF